MSRASLVSGPGAKISAQKWPPPDTNLSSLVFVELCGANLGHCGSEVGLRLGVRDVHRGYTGVVSSGLKWSLVKEITWQVGNTAFIMPLGPEQQI